MRICLVGNSHLACIKKAWDTRASDFPGVDVRFFASSANSIVDTTVSGSSIIPRTDQVKNSFVLTSGGLDVIVPSDYDAMVLYGFSLNLRQVLQLKDRLAASSGVSSAFRDKATIYNNPSSSHVYRLRASFSTGRWITCMRPNTAAEPGSSETPVEQFAGYYGDAQRALVPLFEKFGMEYIQQPVETLASMDETLSHFNLGGYGLGTKPKAEGYTKISVDKNRNHMNDDYGGIMLKSMVDHIKNRN